MSRPMSALARTATCIVAGLAAALAAGCGGKPSRIPLAENGRVAIAVELPEAASPGLSAAADDLMDAAAAITGASTGRQPGRHPIVVTVDPAGDPALGEQGFRIEPRAGGIAVTALNSTGAMYGLYTLIADLGVIYLHPEESFFPSDPAAAFDTARYDGTAVTPRFGLRGFHEHTQHPIVESDFLLRHDDPSLRQFASRHLRWLARNRQNVLSFMALKTVDRTAWIPYIAGIVDEAHGYGIRVNPFISFADQQQNAWKMVEDGRIDPVTGQPVPDEEQIAEGLDWFLAAGFDSIGLQIGSSEFTKPGDTRLMGWLDTTLAHLGLRYPGVTAWAWIHIACDLHDDAGGYFYHLPLQAGTALGAYVHTTMFYTLDHPAPIYECADFSHQKTFMDRGSGQRPLVYFPETAWWLGFDNNLPLILPVTGWSRDYDLNVALAGGGWQVGGHVTFTTGREWTYWQYDHYLCRATWGDRDPAGADLGWEAYLDQLGPLYGSAGPEAAGVLKGWTGLQVGHLYEENPDIFFYLAGERPQDEMGEMAGVYARRPKLAFQTVADYDETEFAAWKSRDYDMLLRIRSEYAALLETLPAATAGSEQQIRLFRELRRSLEVYVSRIGHAIELYAGVTAVREWQREVARAAALDPPGEPDPSVRQTALAEAQARLAAACAITAGVTDQLQAAEADYRHPVGLLAREKPESRTAYPFGYLYETSTGFFWSRRDEQLERLIGLAFQTIPEEWGERPERIFFAEEDGLKLTLPDHRMARDVIEGFLPRLLFGVTGHDPGTDRIRLLTALDGNRNFLPDPASEQAIDGMIEGAVWNGSGLSWPITVRDSAGVELGELVVLEPLFALQTEDDGGSLPALVSGTLAGSVPSGPLVAMVVSGGGIDQEGVSSLVRSIWDLPRDQPLPDTLPIGFAFTFAPVP